MAILLTVTGLILLALLLGAWALESGFREPAAVLQRQPAPAQRAHMEAVPGGGRETGVRTAEAEAGRLALRGTVGQGDKGSGRAGACLALKHIAPQASCPAKR